MNSSTKKVIVIGSGFAGLCAAGTLAKEGIHVILIEKNEQLGGRARVWKEQGFTFDMGPSWYWMPEVFENYYQHFGKKASDFYDLHRISPSYRIYFGKNDVVDVPSDYQSLRNLFEEIEPGSGDKLFTFLNDAKYKYETGMNDFVWRPSNSITEFFELSIVKALFKMNLFGSVSSEVRSLFKHPKLRKLLEFPVLFLGATPQNTPGLYSLMNYADLVLGTWYPMGGMNEIVKAMESIAIEQGVEIHLNEEVIEIQSESNNVSKVITNKSSYEVSGVIAAADYAHVDKKLLSKKDANYTPQSWDKRTMSPSSLLFYVGVNKRLKNILHHNLFFDEDFEQHAKEIYTEPQWPSKPLFYVCCPSLLDRSTAPDGHENLFFLIPLAPGLKDDEIEREKYFEMMLLRLENYTGESIRNNIVVKRSYAMNDFVKDYHSYKGNAYGLANTLLQTAFLKPKMKSRKLKNLFYAGQLTVPGPGVPPAIISGQLAARELIYSLKKPV
jgi:phytoene desaturase